MVEETSKLIEESPLATYTTKGFRVGTLWSNIAITTVLSLAIMSMLTMVGVPPLVVMVVFLASIYFFIYIRSGHTVYSIYSWGFTQSVSRRVRWQHNAKRSFLWNDVLSYQRGIDMNRSKKEYNYIKIKLSKDPHDLSFNDSDNDMKAFMSFCDVFSSKVDELNAEFSQNVVSPESAPRPATGTDHIIKKKKDFYQTLFAKILTLFLVLLSLSVVYYGFTNSLRATSLYRVSIVILPGTAYMFYRVFLRKGK